jgi:DNA-binding transcriptional ArsR family regulator
MGSATVDSDVFRAIADPTRRALLDRLRASDHSVADLARPFHMSRPAISQHIRILRTAGLVRPRRAGRRMLYRINPRPLREVFNWSRQHLVTDPVGHVWSIRSKEVPHGNPGR